MKNEEVITYMNQIHEKSDWKALLESWQVKDWYPFDETGDVANLQIPTLCIAGEIQKMKLQLLQRSNN